MSRKQILIATANQGKAKEIEEIFQGTELELKFLFDFEEELKDIDIQENAKSFEGNAIIKAVVIGEHLKMITLADDSGICVDALDGRPGVFSARYSEEKTDDANNEKVLREMRDVPDEKRTCHYNCTVAIYDPKTKFVETVCGEWHGKLAHEPRGTKSFGYAPIFLCSEADFKKTNAEFDPHELIKINHRGQAFGKAIEILNGYLF